ncbi:PI-actitoxin-Afv2b-like [Neocloeon triangulifer]|uniref:PI-actitoxin-Afv2b-like n=1 Tax=Neocloeon triangulifer TaxID=2078957 RepID=UPI00286F55CB|nr:PI-actitoxin-Afv2b-like [Neocloeon triangulifer]
MLTRYLISLALLCLIVHATHGIKPIPPPPPYCRIGPIKNGQTNSCEAIIPSFTFNSRTGKCENFIYGGCNGSRNLFKTRAQCRVSCEQFVQRG